MSVAFRRESDEEHLEPKFELPIPPGPNVVTQRGYDLIKARTDDLEAAAGAASDEEQRKRLQRDLRYWRSRLATAQIAAAPTGSAVAIGTQVTFEQGDRVRKVTLVGHDEADPAAGLLSFGSPLGRALMGAEIGDEVEVPGQDEPLAIVAIEVA
jgi:transcription elongation GreA/GreB family factor